MKPDSLRRGYRVPWYRYEKLEGYTYHLSRMSVTSRMRYMESEFYAGVSPLAAGDVEDISVTPHHAADMTASLGAWYTPLQAESERRDSASATREACLSLQSRTPYARRN